MATDETQIAPDEAADKAAAESGLSYLICPDCLKQYGDADLEFCPDDGARLRRLKVDPEEDKLLGQTIDEKWRIETKLGQGGMGAVYLAQQLNIERKVAIKVMRKGLDSGKEYIERFLREANVASQVSHPHMVSIFDFGQLEDGGLFIVMEYLDGDALGERVQDNPLTVNQALDVTSQLCAALAAAHAGGIVHRDLKPDNIFLLDMPGGDIFVKVLDFGIAKHLNAQKAVTQTGQVFGTPEYMSPEQCRGESGIDQRSDLYSLGCILYELMTGRVPFRASSLLKILFMHVSDPIPALELKHPDGSLRELEEIALKLLEKDPDKRYGSALEVRQAIEEARRTIKGHDVPLPSWKVDRSKRAQRQQNSGPVSDRNSQRETANILPNNTALDVSSESLAETMLPGDDEAIQKVLSGELPPETVQEREPEHRKATIVPTEHIIADADDLDFDIPPSRSKLIGAIVVICLLLGAGGAALAAKYEVGPFAAPVTDPEQPNNTTASNNTSDTSATTAAATSEADMAPSGGDDKASVLASAITAASGEMLGAISAAHALADATAAVVESKKPDKKTNDKGGKEVKKGGKKIVPDLGVRSPRTEKKTINRLAGKARGCMTFHRTRTPEMFAKYAGSEFKLEFSFRIEQDGTVRDVKILNKPQVGLPSAGSFYGCITSKFEKTKFKPAPLPMTVTRGQTFTFRVPAQ